MHRPRRRATCLGAVAAALAACQGSGSDIGPALQKLPDASCKALVLDDAGRPVCEAKVTVGSASMFTGRSGRGDLLADPRGEFLVQVDGEFGASTDTSALGALAFVTTLPGLQLPFAVYLPDFSGTAGLSLTVGTQPAPRVLDDTASSGARLLVAAGTASSGAFVATAVLQPGHLPGDLPTAGGSAYVFGRGIDVGPHDLAFAPGADLEVTDDLLPPSPASAVLFRLDPTTGVWGQVVGTTTRNGGRLAFAGGVTTGGLYAFAVPVAAVATVRGRVTDTQGRAVPDALVRCGEATTTSAGDGTFTCSVGAVRGDGQARTLAIEVRGGRGWRTDATATSVPLPGISGAFDVGSIAIDTVPVGNVRAQLVVNGHLDPFQRMNLSSLEQPQSWRSTGDAKAQVLWEDVPAGSFGTVLGRRRDRDKVFEALTSVFLPTGRAWFDGSLFEREEFWSVGSRVARAVVIDANGGGPIRDAVVTRGSTAGQGFAGFTQENGVVATGRSFDGRATASVQTTRAGFTRTAAITFVAPDCEHLEMPLERAERPKLGAFERHARFDGQLRVRDPAFEQRVLARRRLDLSDWFDAVFLDRALDHDLPAASVVPDPSLSFFRVGIADGGALSFVDGRSLAGRYRLEGATCVTGFSWPVEVVGAPPPRDPIAIAPADTTYVATGALAGLDAAIAPAALRFDLGLDSASGVGDVVRDVAENLAVTGGGQDVQLQLPAVPGAGSPWLVCLRGRADTPSGTVDQRSLIRVSTDGASGPGMLAVPGIVEPLPGAVVASTGFTIRYNLPAACTYAVIELVSNDATTGNSWQVITPQDSDNFAFVTLPDQALNPLVPGRTWTLRVTAFQITTGPLLGKPNPYRDLTSFWYSVDTAERGVTAIASRTITVTSN